MPVTNIKGDWSSGSLIIVRTDTGATVATIASTGITLASGAILELNTGADLTVNGDSLIAEVAALTGLDSGELQVLNAVTPGTVAASKAVVVDVNKDIGDFRNLDAVNIDAGASGTAGTVDVFPATALKGKLTLSCANQTGDTAVTVNANAMGQATQVNIADPGAAASYVVQSTAAVTLAEADVLDGATAGTAVASKVVVVDANKDVTSLRNIGLDGSLTFGAGGTLVSDNGTATAVAGAATISKMAGIVTSESLTTAADGIYTLTLTNTLITAASNLLVTVGFGTSTAGQAVLEKVTPGAGSATIVVRNHATAAAFNGTLIIQFLLVKP